MTTASGPARRSMSNARSAGKSETARKIVRAGWAAHAVVYAVLAWLTLQSAFGSSSQEISSTGVLRTIAGGTLGKVLLVTLGIGLLAFALGRILEVTTLATSEIETKDKAKAVLVAVLTTSLAISAFAIAGLTSGSSGGSSGAQSGSNFLFSLPGGRWIVGLIGLALIGYGIYQVYKGVKRRYLGTLHTERMSSSTRNLADKLGLAAHTTKGAIMALLGWFLLQAAITYNPQEAKGLDAALGSVAASTWGTAILTLVALGLLTYAAFCLLESKYRRIGSSASTTT